MSKAASLIKGASNPAELARQLIARQKAKLHLVDYAQFIDPNYRPFGVHHYIAERLEDVEAGRSRRLAIFVPPAIGKSRLASEIFPSWVLGRNPTFEVIAASYDYDLAKGFGRAVRNFVMEPRFKLIFPDVDVSTDARSQDSWRTTAGGEYKAEGVGGGLVGFHANIAIIDDPVKNYAQAVSPPERKKMGEWYSSTLLNRLRSYKGGPGAIILIMQRWHDDDLGGRIEKLHESGAEQWEIIRLPSLAEGGDPLGREEGEALLPEGPNRRTVEELATIRMHNPSLFMALHQQKPVSDEGDIFNPSWLRKYHPDELPTNITVYGSSDFALSEGQGDYTVHMVFGVDKVGHIWILDLWRRQAAPAVSIDACIELMRQYKPLKWLNEKWMINKAIGPLLNQRKQAAKVWTVMKQVSPATGATVHMRGKVAKSSAIAGLMQLGFVHVPYGAAWVGDMEWELSRFPNAKNDDIVDALSLIGMDIEHLRGIGPDSGDVVLGPIELHPAAFTFNQAVMRRTARRLGRRVSKESMLLEAPRCEWLEEA